MAQHGVRGRKDESSLELTASLVLSRVLLPPPPILLPLPPSPLSFSS